MNRRTIGYLITMAALLISIPRYIATFDHIDPSALTSYGMGILLAGGAAYIFDAWSDATRRGIKNPNRLLVAVAINLVYEPILLTPFILSMLWEQPLKAVMGNEYAVLWAIMVTAAPVILVCGVVYAISYQKQVKSKQSTYESENESDRSKTKPKPRKGSTGVFPCKHPGCDMVCDSQNGLNSHMKVHKNGREKERVPTAAAAE